MRRSGIYLCSLAEKTQLSQKTIYVRIKALKENGILKRVGSDTKGYWNINENK